MFMVFEQVSKRSICWWTKISKTRQKWSKICASAVASWYCWYSLTKSFILLSASVNSISSWFSSALCSFYAYLCFYPSLSQESSSSIPFFRRCQIHSWGDGRYIQVPPLFIQSWERLHVSPFITRMIEQKWVWRILQKKPVKRSNCMLHSLESAKLSIFMILCLAVDKVRER